MTDQACDFEWSGPVPCLRCDGEGIILICPDSLCQGAGHCMHGDGEVTCPDCEGEGCLP